MLALAAARECGVSRGGRGARDRALPATPPMRVTWEPLGTATLINDAYNANPASMRAALELLAQAGAGRQRVAVLGTMLELGAHAARLHDEVARVRAGVAGGAHRRRRARSATRSARPRPAMRAS